MEYWRWAAATTSWRSGRPGSAKRWTGGATRASTWSAGCSAPRRRWRAWRRPGRWAPAPIRPLPADPSWCGSSLAAIAPWTRWWSAAGASDSGAYRAAAALERAGEVLEGLGLPRLSAPVAAALFAAHVEKGAARSRREKSSGAPVVEDPERGRSLPVPSAPRTAMAVAPEVSVEPLRLKLFGTMEVAVGRRDITYQFEGRPKTRLLLALLALHRGRELGRDQIVSMLWPAADKRTGAKSFYRVWGDLRSLLSQQGSCPYLIRSRYGCRLDPDLFESDLDEFEELIRCLLFGPADDMAWERAIATIQGSFGSVLLPTERKCEAIVVFRDRLDAEFVDGLVAASRRLLVRGAPGGAVARSGGLSARCGARGRGGGSHARADGHRSALGRRTDVLRLPRPLVANAGTRSLAGAGRPLPAAVGRRVVFRLGVRRARRRNEQEVTPG